MQCDTGEATEQANAPSDRLIALLRQRVKENRNQELVRYLDELMPPFEIPAETKMLLDDRKLAYKLTDFLQYYGEEFLMVTYLCLFKRSVDDYGLATGMQSLKSGSCSRILLLGWLRYSEEGKRHGVEIEGLRFRYFFERLRNVRFLGKVVAPLLNLTDVFRLDREIDKQNAGITLNTLTLGTADKEMSGHYNGVIDRLSTAQPGQFEIDGHSATTPEAHGYLPTSLNEFTSLPGVSFVRLAYLTALKREATDTELRVALSQLHSGEKSKVMLLGDLYESSQAKGSSEDVAGLCAAYRAEKLSTRPLIGQLFQLPAALRKLSRLSSIIEYQSGEIASCNREILKMERRIMTHYNNTLIRLKCELVDALKETTIQK